MKSSFIECPETDEEVRALLAAWIKTVQKYCKHHDNADNPWWYNERATLSTLAGAAWTIGWCALEEYSSQKRKKAPVEGVDNGKTKFRSGRVDLFLASAEGTSITIEAKQAWQRIGSKSNKHQYVYKGMKAAWEDSNYLIADHSTRRFAATFIAPSIPLSEAGDSAKRLVSQWLEEMGDFTRPGGKSPSYAYVFPSMGKNGFNTLTRHYPGVVLVLEERFKATKAKK